MSIFRLVILLDDTVPSQATLLGQIQNALASIASNVIPAGSPIFIQNIEVRKVA